MKAGLELEDTVMEEREMVKSYFMRYVKKNYLGQRRTRKDGATIA